VAVFKVFRQFLFIRRDIDMIYITVERATNPQNQKPDIAAIEAFCVMLTKESEGVQIGTKLLAAHIQSLNESEALQALSVFVLEQFSILIFSNNILEKQVL